MLSGPVLAGPPGVAGPGPGAAPGGVRGRGRGSHPGGHRGRHRPRDVIKVHGGYLDRRGLGGGPGGYRRGAAGSSAGRQLIGGGPLGVLLRAPLPSPRRGVRVVPGLVAVPGLFDGPAVRGPVPVRPPRRPPVRADHPPRAADREPGRHHDPEQRPSPAERPVHGAGGQPQAREHDPESGGVPVPYQQDQHRDRRHRDDVPAPVRNRVPAVAGEHARRAEEQEPAQRPRPGGSPDTAGPARFRGQRDRRTVRVTGPRAGGRIVHRDGLRYRRFHGPGPASVDAGPGPFAATLTARPDF